MPAYSLWVIPPEPAYGKCAALIDSLAVSHNAPRFEPHVTVIGNAGSDEAIAIRTAEALARSIQAFPIELAEIEQQDTFFQCLYLRARQTSSLMAVNDKAREAFERTDDPPYMPHLSLMYGNFPEATKRDMASGIDLGDGIMFHVDRLYVICASTDMPIEEWHRVAEIRLGDPAATT
jgi:2'-5' RNA ligase